MAILRVRLRGVFPICKRGIEGDLPVAEIPPDPPFHPQGVRRWVPRCCATTLPQAKGGISSLVKGEISFLAMVRLICGVMLLLTLTPARAATSEYELKAAFIYQIAKFVEWPSSGTSLRLCVLGGNPFGPALETIRDKPVNERRMEVSLLDTNADTRECNLLFIAAPAEKHIERITAISRGNGVLTIGDTEGFAQRGAIVNFFLENGKIRFEINLESSRRAGLKISSQLLKLARIIQEEAP